MKINLGAGGNTNNKCSLRLKTLIKFISTRKDRGRINNHYEQSSKKQAGGGCDFEKNPTMIMSQVKICITITIIINTIHHSLFFISQKPHKAILKLKIMVFEKLSKYDLLNLIQVFKYNYLFIKTKIG